MPKILELKHSDVFSAVATMGRSVLECINVKFPEKRSIVFYAIPRGGIPVLYTLLHFLDHKEKGYKKSTLYMIAEKVEDADILIDDIICTGRTKELYPDKPFFALFDKREEQFKSTWIRFPWESSPVKEKENYISQIIEFIGDNPNREGLSETPLRVVKSWKELYKGYSQEPKDIYKEFIEDINDDENVHSMVISKDNEFFSMCEHHMLPFFGKMSVIYQPTGKVIGLSKIPRLIDMYARRLQVQERLTNQVCGLLFRLLNPKFVYVVCDAQHLCVQSRGVLKYNSRMRTTAYKGATSIDSFEEANLHTLLNDLRR